MSSSINGNFIVLPDALYRLSEIATTPAKPCRQYIDKRTGKIRHINAKPSHKGITPLGASTILRWCKDGRFPAPIRKLKGITVWRGSDISQFLESLSSTNTQGDRT